MIAYSPTEEQCPAPALLPSPDVNDLYQCYLADLTASTPLAPGEDDALMQRVALVHQGQAPQTDLPLVRQRLIEGSLRLVVHIAMRTYRYLQAASGGKSTVDLMDMIQEGNTGLMQCVHHCTNTASPPADFSAYAAAYIRYALSDYQRRRCVVAVSKDDWQAAAEQGKSGLLLQGLSLDTPRQGKDERSLLERLPAPALAPDDESPRRQHVKELCATLPPRERQVLCLRYGIDLEESDQDDQEIDLHPHTYEETAAKLSGCCQTTCMNLERKALRALREGVRLRTCGDYYSFSEVCQVLGLSPTAIVERVHQGIIHRYIPFADEQIGVYAKAEIDALARELQHIQEHYCTLEEAAARLGLSPRAVRNKEQAGLLARFHRPGQARYNALYLKTEVERLAQEREQAAQTFASQYYQAAEAAARLGIARGSLPRWVREGKLTRQVVAGWRYEGYPKAEVDALAQQQRPQRPPREKDRVA